MKKLILPLLLLPLSIHAQVLPTDKAGRITFSEAVEVRGMLQNSLQEKAKNILEKSFSATPGTKMIEAPGSITFRGYAFYNINKIGVELPYFFNFILYLSFEDCRYKYTTTDFVDDENIPLEKGLLKPKDIYNDRGEVKAESKEILEAISSGLKSVGEIFKDNMIASFAPKKY
jgi:hypothetical protein